MTKQIDQPFILGCPENDDDLLQEASELSSLEKIKATNQKLVGDAVARKELNGRITHTKINLGQTIKNTLDQTLWFFNNDHLGKTSLYLI